MKTQLKIDSDREIRNRLAEKRAELLRQAEQEEAVLAKRSEQNPDRGSLSQSYTQRQVKQVIHDRHIDQVEEIDTALRRLKQGLYGICAICDGAIAPARLAVRPQATTCVACKNEQEQRR